MFHIILIKLEKIIFLIKKYEFNIYSEKIECWNNKSYYEIVFI